MNNIFKRIFTILIATAISFGSVINVGAADDTEAVVGEAEAQEEVVTEAETSSEESISPKIQKMMTVLKAFNIIPDYYDYNVPLTYDVSRSDFAAAVARMMNKTEYYGSEVYFYDVPKNYWAFNEISNLTEMGILSGAGDKTFNPGEPITKGAAYKILLCAMGYREYAENAGGYPKGYISVASNIKLSSGVSGSENVTMSDMLCILYNALTINIMELGDLSGNSIIYKVSDDETLISSYRNIYYDEGNVNGANSVTINGESLNKGYTLIDDEKYKCEGFNMMEYLGEKIEFFYEDDDLSDEKRILWVGHKMSSQDIKYISVDGDAKLDTDTFVYTYCDENDRRHKINLDRGALLIYNGEVIESGYDKILNDNKYELKLISNNDKYTMVVRSYKNYVVGNISSADCLIYDKNVPKDFVNLNRDDYNTFSIKLMGNDDMDFEDIKKDSVLTVYQSKGNIEVYVSNNTVNGKVERYYTEKGNYVTINGTDYRLDSRISNNSYAAGDNVTAHLSVYGEVVYIEVNAGVFQGSFLLEAIYREQKDILYVKQLGEDSKVSKLKCAEKVVIDGTKYKNPKDAYEALLAGEAELTAQFARIKKNEEGEIIEIDTVEGKETANSLQIDVPFWYGTETTYTQRLIRANANAARIGEKIVFDAATKVFVVPYVTDYKDVSEDDLWVTVGSKLANDTGTYAQSYRTTEKAGIAQYILLKGYEPSKVNAELPILAQKIIQGMDDDGNVIEILKGYQGGSSVSIKAHEDEGNLFSKNGVAPGDVVTIKKDAYGNVKECTVKYDFSKGELDAQSKLNDALGVFAGYAHDVVDNVVKIGYASGADFDFAINAMSKPVLLYDTSQTKNPISVATTGDIVTYENSHTRCSKVVIVTNKMQPQMFVIYK